MRQISEAEFNTRDIAREVTPVTVMLGRPPTEERAWYAHGKRLGIVLLDLIDHDWSFVKLEKKGDGKFRAIDVGASFPSQEAATNALQRSFAGAKPSPVATALMEGLCITCGKPSLPFVCSECRVKS